MLPDDIEVRGANGVITSCPLSMVASFCVGREHPSCLGIVHRQYDQTTACWVFNCDSAAKAKAHLGELAQVCADINKRRRRGKQRTPSCSSVPDRDGASSPITPTLEGSCELPDPPRLKRTNSTPQPSRVRTPSITVVESSRTPPATRRVLDPSPTMAETTRAKTWEPGLSASARNRRGQVPRTARPSAPLDKAGSRLVRVNTYRPQTMGCALTARFLGQIDPSTVEGKFKDEQARIDVILKAAPALDPQKCPEVLVTVISSWLTIRSLNSSKRAGQQDVQLRIKRTFVKFCGQGNTRKQTFGIIVANKKRELVCYTFHCDSNQESISCVHGLARAFGAGHKQDQLLNSTTYEEARNAGGKEQREAGPAIEVEEVSYIGHMELVSDDVIGVANLCHEQLLQLPSSAPATIAVRNNLVEFVENGSVAKWFLLDKMESIQVQEGLCTMVVSRGRIPNVRFFGYCYLAESEQQAKQLCKFILTAIRAFRRENILSLEHMFEYQGLAQILQRDTGNQVQELLQQELDRMKEIYRSIVVKRFNLQKVHLKSEAEQNKAMLSLIISLYRDYKKTDVQMKASLLSKKPYSLSSHLATSLESLVHKAGGNLSVSLGNVALHSPKVSRRAVLPRKGSKSKDPGSPQRRPKDKREWRQSLFKAVTAKSPRQHTPGRRSSQSILFSLPLKMECGDFTKATERRAFVRRRWRKAMEQTLMLTRMAKQNEDLDVSKKLAAQAASSQQKQRLEQLWAPMWATPPTEWDPVQLRSCVRAGMPAHLRGRYLIALAQRFKAASKPSKKYVDLLMQPCIYRHAIRIDIGRTFPDVPYFSKEMGSGQALLYNCMAAYSNLDEEVGYCQGLCFPAGLFLLQMNEEDAFKTVTSVLFEHGIREQYMPDMIVLQVQLYQFSRLLHDVCRPVYERLAELGIEPYFYVSQWFLCWFSSNFPKSFAERLLGSCTAALLSRWEAPAFPSNRIEENGRALPPACASSVPPRRACARRHP